jgi:hypothetical protein
VNKNINSLNFCLDVPYHSENCNLVMDAAVNSVENFVTYKDFDSSQTAFCHNLLSPYQCSNVYD